MPQYQITSPDGRKFKVTAPEGATQEQVLSYAQSNYSGGEEAPKQKDQNDMGPLAAFVQNTPAVPFAQRIQAGGAAAVNYPIAKLTGSDVSLKDLYETAREKQIATDEANPDAALAGGITGAVASLPIAMAGLPGKVNSATKLGKAADISNKVAVATDKFVRGAATTGGKIGRAAGVGAGTAGVYGYGASKNDLDTGAAFQDADASAAIGAPLAAIPGATSAAKSGISRVASDLRPKSVLTTQQLKDAAAPLYDKFTQSGGIYSSRLTDEMADLAENSKLTGIAGKQKASDKALNDVLDFYSSLRGSKLSPQELQRLDQSLAEDISRFNRAGDTNFGRILNDLKYELRAKAYDPKNAVRYIEGGDPSAVQDLLQANKLWSQSYKTRDIEKIVERAGRSENQQTSIRTGLNSLLSNDKKMAQYSPQERKILEDAQKRGAVGGIIKAFGNRLTDTLAGGLTGFTMGGTAGALAGAAAGRAAGGALTNAAGGMQAGRLQNALSKIQTGSPVASQAANVGAALPAAIGLATGVGTAAGRGQQSDAQQPQPPMTKYRKLNLAVTPTRKTLILALVVSFSL